MDLVFDTDCHHSFNQGTDTYPYIKHCIFFNYIYMYIYIINNKYGLERQIWLNHMKLLIFAFDLHKYRFHKVQSNTLNN